MDNTPDFTPNTGSNPNGNRLIRQKLVLLLLLPPIIAGIGLVLFISNKKIGFDNRSRASTTPVTLAFAPQTLGVTSGDTFSLGISLNTGDDTVTAAELHLTYDPSLQVESFVKTNYLPVSLQDASFGNGNASLVLGCDPNNPRKGSGIIATITFKALVSGNAYVKLDGTQIAALGKDTNALPALPQSAKITIGGSATPIPSNTPKPPTITPTLPPKEPTITPSSNNHCLPLGNLNCNTKVDIYDYNKMLHDLGTYGTNLPADLNDNGRVDLQDYNKLLFNYNKTI